MMRMSRPAPRTEAFFHAPSCVPQSRQKRDTRLGSPPNTLAPQSQIPTCIIQQNPPKSNRHDGLPDLAGNPWISSAAPRRHCLRPAARPPPACLAPPRASSRRRSCPASDTLLVSGAQRGSQAPGTAGGMAPRRACPHAVRGACEPCRIRCSAKRRTRVRVSRIKPCRYGGYVCSG